MNIQELKTILKKTGQEHKRDCDRLREIDNILDEKYGVKLKTILRNHVVEEDDPQEVKAYKTEHLALQHKVWFETAQKTSRTLQTYLSFNDTDYQEMTVSYDAAKTLYKALNKVSKSIKDFQAASAFGEEYLIENIEPEEYLYDRQSHEDWAKWHSQAEKEMNKEQDKFLKVFMQVNNAVSGFEDTKAKNTFEKFNAQVSDVVLSDPRKDESFESALKLTREMTKDLKELRDAMKEKSEQYEEKFKRKTLKSMTL